MIYTIKKKDKQRLIPRIVRLCLAGINNSGELNYVISEIIEYYITNKTTTYQKINDVLGALEGAKLEIYRRAPTPYKAIKIEENGDVG